MPALLRSWTTVLNTVPTQTTQAIQAMELIFNRKRVFLLAGWAVMGSSNSVAAGMDGVDRWVTSANVVRGTGGAVRSWIVLRSPAGFASASTYVYVMISHSATNVYQANITWSSAVFTGSSTTANPTTAALGESVMPNKAVAPPAFLAGKYHYGYSTVGDVFFLFSQNASGIFATGCLAASAANPQAGELYQCLAVENETSPFNLGYLYNNANVGMWNQAAGSETNVTGVMTPTNGGGQTVMAGYTSAGSKIDGTYPAVPALIAASRNFKGTLVDIWLAPTGLGILEGSEIPAAPAASTHFNCGALWLPSGGQTPSL